MTFSEMSSPKAPHRLVFSRLLGALVLLGAIGCTAGQADGDDVDAAGTGGTAGGGSGGSGTGGGAVGGTGGGGVAGTGGGSGGSAAAGTGGSGGSAAGGRGGQGGTSGTGGAAGNGGAAGRGGASGAGGVAGGRGGAGGTGGTAGSGGSAAGGRGGAAGTGGTAAGGRGGTAGSGGGGGTSGSNLPGFRVSGRHLYDRCGVKVVLRGVNEMVVWTGGKDGTPEFAEIARTGANVVRIVWTTVDGNATELDRAIGNAVAQQLIPMPELHDATGNRAGIPAVVDYWVRSDVAAVIRKYEQVALVNIANEAGDGNVTAAQFTSDYTTAINRMRTAGYRVPLILDAPNWGQNIDVLQSAGPGLLNADPDHNLMFSVHMWWNDPNGTRVMNELNMSVNANLPLIVGEFAHHAVTNCANAPFAYRTLLAQAQTQEVGWLAWSWGGLKNSDCASSGPFDMTTAGTFATLTGWGLEVAVSDTNSIQRTSVRPRSMTAGSCQ